MVGCFRSLVAVAASCEAKDNAIKAAASFKPFGFNPFQAQDLAPLNMQVQIALVTRLEGRIIAVYEKYGAHKSKLCKHITSEVNRASKGDNSVDISTTHPVMRKFIEESMGGSVAQPEKRPSHTDSSEKKRAKKTQEPSLLEA